MLPNRRQRQRSPGPGFLPQGITRRIPVSATIGKVEVFARANPHSEGKTVWNSATAVTF